MAVTLIGASVLIPQPHVARRKAILAAVILGVSLLLAGIIIAMEDPTLLALFMPILGGGAAAVVVTSALKGASS